MNCSISCFFSTLYLAYSFSQIHRNPLKNLVSSDGQLGYFNHFLIAASVNIFCGAMIVQKCFFWVVQTMRQSELGASLPFPSPSGQGFNFNALPAELGAPSPGCWQLAFPDNAINRGKGTESWVPGCKIQEGTQVSVIKRNNI